MKKTATQKEIWKMIVEDHFNIIKYTKTLPNYYNHVRNVINKINEDNSSTHKKIEIEVIHKLDKRYKKFRKGQ